MRQQDAGCKRNGKMKQLRGLLLLLAVWAILTASGCAANLPPAQPDKAAAGYEVEDSTGAVLTLAHKPERIVSLSIGTDEILVGLVPAERIAALTYLADDSGISSVTEQARQVPRKVKANGETIIGLQPDLVLIPDWQPVELVQTIRDAGIPVYVYKSPNTIEQIKQTINEIAHVVGEEQQGTRIVAQMDSELAQVREKIGHIPDDEQQVVVRFTLMGGSGGIGSTFDDICRYAGVKNGAAVAGLDREGLLSKEQIVAVNPDILIMPTWDYSGKTDMEKFRADIQADPALQTVKAVRQKKLIQVPDRYLYCTSQYIVYGVRDVATAAYPGSFGQQ